MQVLITGGTGFIGSQLALKCLENGDSVRVFAKTNTPAEEVNKKIIEENGGEIVLGSMTELTNFPDLLSGVDVVYHLAATQHEANIPDKIFWDVNVEGTRDLLEACIGKGIKRFVHGSTIGVYGALAGEIKEESPCNPDNIYGVTKLAGEKLVISYKEKLPVVAIRICETYGPGDRRLLKLFKGISKKYFFLIGSGQNLHHLIYIDDLIQGFFLAADKESEKGEVFLLADDTPVTTQEMMQTISADLNVSLPKFRSPLWPFLVTAVIMEATLKPLGIQPPIHRRRMDFFIKSFSLSNKKAKKILGFAPRFSFSKGVHETRKWYEEQGMLDRQQSLNPSEQKDNHSTENKIKEEKIIPSKFQLTAITEPFDTFWEAPKNIEKGYDKFEQFYTHNYLKYIPLNKEIKILAVSCGPGYFVNLLKKKGYKNVIGIDSSPEKIKYAEQRNLNCRVEHAFDFLHENQNSFDLIFAEQEINHLTKEEILQFFDLCHGALKTKGQIIVHSLNGANPITGPEALAQNFDHYNTFTEYSIRQILKYSNFENIEVFPLRLYIFYKNPLNYIGIALDTILNLLFRTSFVFYGKANKLFSKKIAATGKKA